MGNPTYRMMSFDTEHVTFAAPRTLCVVSAAFRRAHCTTVKSWLPQIEEPTLFISERFCRHIGDLPWGVSSTSSLSREDCPFGCFIASLCTEHISLLSAAGTSIASISEWFICFLECQKGSHSFHRTVHRGLMYQARSCCHVVMLSCCHVAA